MKHLSTLVTIATVLILSAGCSGGEDSYVPPGSLEVSWQLGGSTCTKSDVQSIRIMVFDAVNESVIYDQVQVACQVGTHTFRSLPAAEYHVVVEGYRPGTQVAWYRGTSATPVPVTSGQISTAQTIFLEQNPGWLELTWVFEPNSLCGFAGVNTVSISVWDEFSKRVYSGAFPCDPNYARAQALEEAGPVDTEVFSAGSVPVVDIYSGTYTIDAFAYFVDPDTDQAGDYRWWSQVEATVDVGSGTPVQLTLQSCEGVNFCN